MAPGMSLLLIIVVIAVVVGVMVAQRAAGTATQGRADQATGGAAHLVADHLAAGCAQATADGGFRLVAVAGTDRATGRTADTATNGGAGAATDRLADDRTQYPAQGATDAGTGVAVREGGTTDQRKRQQEHRGVLHREVLCVDVGADAAVVRRRLQASADE